MSRQLLVACLFLALTVTRLAAAEGAAPEPKTEARERFGRGLRLFNAGDNAGALAEFERAYALSPHSFVLYNIGMVHSAMGRSVDAADTLGRVLSNPGSLEKEMLERARSTREAELARVAEIAVSANVEGGDVEIDGLPVGRTPLARPLRVTSGRRIVGVVAPGYAPERREVSVAGQTKVSVRFELKAFEGRLAHLEVRSSLPGVDVVVDDKPVGKTPLPATLALVPGKHSVELRRAGFVTARRQVDVAEGATGRISFEPEVDAAALATEGGRLALDLTESDAVVRIDGKPFGKYTASLRLPAGPHALVIERDGFDTVSRQVDVARGATTTVRVDLEPTPEYRASFEKKATLFRTWGWVGVIGGAVVAGAGTGYLVWNNGKKDEFLDEAAEFIAFDGNTKNGNLCNTAKEFSAIYDADDCNERRLNAMDEYDSAARRDVLGWLGVGVGAAALVTGGVLLLTGDDPSRYTHERPELARPKVRPSVWIAGDARGLGLLGSF